ncbi:MAG TPA: ShlB/FhaC/HecB family hemolysin secretion/activation protein, partial [Thiotrichales bacterium]|nr:ShlB/FhaC/HecB family hemolysin secretion/activation protein [Thiotrichales bacterium]
MDFQAFLLNRFLFGFLLVFAGFVLQSKVWAVEEPPQIHFVVKKFNVIGDNPLSEGETDSVLSAFLGDHYGLEGLQAASDALEKTLVDKGFSFYRVTFIPQELQNGVITFSVSEFDIGKVTVEGNKHFNDANIRRSVPQLKAGSAPNTRELSRSLHLANAQPSKKLSVKFAGSEVNDEVNATIKVVDQSPGFFFVALNNTGTDETGKFRITGGYQYSNLFNRDHSATLSYTTS